MCTNPIHIRAGAYLSHKHTELKLGDQLGSVLSIIRSANLGRVDAETLDEYTNDVSTLHSLGRESTTQEMSDQCTKW